MYMDIADKNKSLVVTLKLGYVENIWRTTDR